MKDLLHVGQAFYQQKYTLSYASPLETGLLPWSRPPSKAKSCCWAWVVGEDPHALSCVLVFTLREAEMHPGAQLPLYHPPFQVYFKMLFMAESLPWVIAI